MGATIDLTGQRFGRLVVVGRADPPSNEYGNAVWHCRCDCGNEKDIDSHSLRNGDTRSCGCLQRERVAESHTTHGRSSSRLYYVWQHMIQRCENQHNPAYDDYGGRGIKICEEWHDFKTFEQWAERTGYRDDLTIDRIDVNEGYNPVNCRWATTAEQARNKRNNINITYRGVTRCLSDWATTLGIGLATLWYRIFEYGWDIERAFTMPVQKHRKHNQREEQEAS